MKKKLLATLLTAVVAAGVLAGCGSEAADTAASTTAEAADAAASTATETADAAATDFGGVTIKVAASPTPHAEILEAAAPILEKEGIKLDVQVFEGYVQPNNVVESGDFQANYFQHVPYMENFNEEQGTHLVVAGKIHYEPFGLYPGAKATLDEITDGDSVAIPNDTTNETRALLLLQDNGLITLNDGIDASTNATINDIKENPHNLEIVELEAAQIPQHKGDIDYLVMNGNYALEAGYTVSDNALTYEKSDSSAAQTYVNVIAVKEGSENDAAIQELVRVLKSDDIKAFIQQKYGENVIPYDGE